jgi:hypothetical protein
VYPLGRFLGSIQIPLTAWDCLGYFTHFSLCYNGGIYHLPPRLQSSIEGHIVPRRQKQNKYPPIGLQAIDNGGRPSRRIFRVHLHAGASRGGTELVDDIFPHIRIPGCSGHRGFSPCMGFLGWIIILVIVVICDYLLEIHRRDLDTVLSLLDGLGGQLSLRATFLGHNVSRLGLSTLKDKIAAV